MVLNYKTGKLPLNFIALGTKLFALSIWRIVVLDWKGILYLIISLLLLFIKSGIVIDTDKLRVKKYIGFLFLKKGEWEVIDTPISLQIIKTNESQQWSVLSISRVVSNEVFKLYLNLPNRKIEVMTGNEKSVCDKANKIASSLGLIIINQPE